MNVGDLLGSVLQSGMSHSTTSRIQNSLGGGGILKQLGGLLGGATGGAAPTSTAGAGSVLGTGALGGGLGNIINEVGRMVGGSQNLALGGLGALAGALLGGKKGLGGAIRGGIGAGAMAVLGMMAYQALKKSGTLSKLKVPVGLVEPKTAAERAELERSQELVLKAMINAAKADGRVEESEIGRIVGKVQETGADATSQAFLRAELEKPMDTDALVAAAKGKPELAAQLYAASLLAIEVDTPAEKEYLAELAGALGLEPRVTEQLHQAVGLRMG